jgi:hypothetical protein
MANLSTPSLFQKNIQDSPEDQKNTLFTIPFSERDVLTLQEIFVKLGIHTIKTKNSSDGRKIIHTILNSLNYHHNIGSITKKHGLKNNVYDIVNHIRFHQSGFSNLIGDLESFFATYACFDFIWIELTQEINNKLFIHDIKKMFEMYHVKERMTVILVEYEEE